MIKAWNNCKKKLENSLTDEEFKAWIDPLEIESDKSSSGDKNIYILAPNLFIKEHVRENYDFTIRKLLEKSQPKKFSLI